MMNRQEKELQIQSLKNDFKKSHATFLVGVQGLTVSQIQELRKNLRAQNGVMRIAKNTLSKIASHEIPEVNELAPYFKKQIALVFAMGDSPAVAKVLYTLSQQNEKIDIVAGCFESHVINKDMIKFLGSLPPRPVLIAQVCGVIKAPLVQPIGVMHQVLARFLWVLKEVEKKRS
jgi:large subunit ribosomal protein L10